MIIRQLFDHESYSFSYLIVDEPTRRAALIDPVREKVERDLALIRELDARLMYVLETHVHADHVTSSGALAEKTGAITCASELGAACVQRRLKHDEVLVLGTTMIRTLATPGHTKDSLSFHVPGHVFTGDALFVRGTGRTDFQSGSASALYESITTKLFTLPDDTVVWPGHDYHGHTRSSIAEERMYNPRIGGNKTREEFVGIMRQLKIPPPKLIAVAIPANLACGRA